MSERIQITIISVVVMIIAVMFYWTAVRPSNIKKECSKDMKEVVILFKSDYSAYEEGQMEKQLGDGINSWINYGVCLKQHGL